MPRCLKCRDDACLKQGNTSQEKFYCVLHFNLDGDLDRETCPVVVIDDEILADQLIAFQELSKKAIASVAVNMFDVQKKEENENRLRNSKVPSSTMKKVDHVPSGVVDNKNKISKGSLWSTNISSMDKQKILQEIEQTEHEENTLKNFENKLGVACVICGSRSTLARNRYAIEACKNEVWGNKDNDNGLVTIECQDCGYIGDNC